MFSPCHIIQLALQKHFCHPWNKIFYVVKHSFFGMLHHTSVYFGEITRVMRHICIFSRNIFSPPIFFPDVRWLLLQITC